jgi:hypothetical protein
MLIWKEQRHCGFFKDGTCRGCVCNVEVPTQVHYPEFDVHVYLCPLLAQSLLSLPMMFLLMYHSLKSLEIFEPEILSMDSSLRNMNNVC